MPTLAEQGVATPALCAVDGVEHPAPLRCPAAVDHSRGDYKFGAGLTVGE